MGVDAIGLRLASRPATERPAAGLRNGAAGGRTTVGSDGAGEEFDIVVDDENDRVSWDGRDLTKLAGR